MNTFGSVLLMETQMVKSQIVMWGPNWPHVLHVYLNNINDSP